MRFSFVFLLATVGLLQGCVPVVAAGVGTGILMAASDRRSAGADIEDETIENKAQKHIDEKYKDTGHVSVTAYNRFALVTGTVANETAKMDIERIVGCHSQRQGHRQ